jgi:hypothetical protein
MRSSVFTFSFQQGVVKFVFINVVFIRVCQPPHVQQLLLLVHQFNGTHDVTAGEHMCQYV